MATTVAGLIALAVATGALILLAACAGHAPVASRPSTPAAANTVVHRIDVRLLSAPGTSSSGSCWTASIAAPVANAYRCFTGNRILDPCFATGPTARQVECAADPWTTPVTLRLTEPLPAATTTTATQTPARPWAMTLADGSHCVAITGTVADRDGVSLAYQCGSSTFAGAPSGAGRLRAPVVTGSAPARMTDVTAVWRG